MHNKKSINNTNMMKVVVNPAENSFSYGTYIFLSSNWYLTFVALLHFSSIFLFPLSIPGLPSLFLYIFVLCVIFLVLVFVAV